MSSLLCGVQFEIVLTLKVQQVWYGFALSPKKNTDF